MGCGAMPGLNKGGAVDQGGAEMEGKSTPIPLTRLLRQRGLSLVGKLLMIPAALIAALIVAIGFYEGRKAYWDAQVREMCAKDGGVRILEEIIVSPSQARLLPKVGNFFGVVSESLAKPEEPAFARTRRTVIREYNPTVMRYEEVIFRRLDQKIVGVIVSYGRGGGDFPSPAHPSNYHCPEYKQLYEGINRLYRIEEIVK